MVAHYLWKACLLTAILLLGITPAQADSSNPEDGAGGGEPGAQAEPAPCEVILIGSQAPYVDFHPECLPEDVWP